MHIHALFLHPLKGGTAVPVDRLTLDPQGPRHDRQWMVVDADGRFLTQREVPAMARLGALPCGEATDADLALTWDGARHVARWRDDGPRREVTVWRHTGPAVDAGDAAAAFVSDALGRPCRLVHLAPEHGRYANPARAPEGTTVGFADGYPLLVTSQATLDAVAAAWGRPLDPRRVRANVIVAGGAPGDDLRWRHLQAAGGVALHLVKPCERCSVPTVHPDRGEVDARDLLRHLPPLAGGEVVLGNNAWATPGVLSRGEALTIVETA